MKFFEALLTCIIRVVEWNLNFVGHVDLILVTSELDQNSE